MPYLNPTEIDDAFKYLMDNCFVIKVNDKPPTSEGFDKYAISEGYNSFALLYENITDLFFQVN